VTNAFLKTGDFSLHLSSSGSVEIEEIQADQITAELSSSGEIQVTGAARRLDLSLSSSGNFEGEDLQVQDAEVRLSSSGNATVWVLEKLDVNISSSGNVTYYGTPGE